MIFLHDVPVLGSRRSFVIDYIIQIYTNDKVFLFYRFHEAGTSLAPTPGPMPLIADCCLLGPEYIIVF